MIQRIQILSHFSLAVLVLIGCASTADLAKGQSSTCEVHRCAMTIQVLDCAPGFSGYRPDYDRARRTQFPNHGRMRFSEDHSHVIYPRHLRTYVCADCTEAHDQWRTEHPNK